MKKKITRRYHRIKLDEALDAFEKRTGRRMLQKELAAIVLPEMHKDSNYRQEVLSLWKGGHRNCPLKYLVRIAESLDCSIDSLIDKQNQPTSEKQYRNAKARIGWVD